MELYNIEIVCDIALFINKHLYPLRMEKIDRLIAHDRMSINKTTMAPKREPLQSISPNLPINSGHCSNHANKQATYSLSITEKEYLFCEKCAISLASQGHSLLKIKNTLNEIHHHSKNRPSDSSSDLREKEISKLVGELGQLRASLQQTKQSIVQKLVESEQFYGQQLQQVNDYFSLIIKSLQLQKNKCYNHILNQRYVAQKHMRAVNEDLIAMEEDVGKIISDIEQNLETAYNIEEEMYRLVLSQYREQQQYFHQNINGVFIGSIQLKKIEFEGVPESIYKLSDIIISSGSPSSDTHLYRVTDSLDSQDFHQILAISPRIDYGQASQYKTINSIDNLQLSFEGEKLRGSVLHQLIQNQEIPSPKFRK